MLRKFAIIGLGVLGGSIARSIKKNYPGAEVSASDINNYDLCRAESEDVVDHIIDYKDVHPEEYDLTVVATPVAPSIKIIKELCLNRNSTSESIIVDVGSVKRFVCDEISPIGNSGIFIGCHPMAGSEKTGYENSSSEIFENASVIITPHEHNRKESIEKVRGFWEKLGSINLEMDPVLHDEVVAYTSHLPHLIACSLVDTLSQYQKKADSDFDKNYFIGNGFRDTTRVSSGSPSLWRDILMLNRKNVESALSAHIEGLIKLRNLLNKENTSSDLIGYLEEVKKYRDEL